MDAICKADYDLRMAAREKAEAELEEAARLRRKSTTQLPVVGYHDFYDVRFSGQLCDIIRQIAQQTFQLDLGSMMHVFVDDPPSGIANGIHPLTVYGRECLLYKWKPQGYHRGVVVLADDNTGNAVARIYMESDTWSWLLPKEFQERLAAVTGGCHG